MMLEISSSPVRAVMATCPEMSVPALVMNCLAPLTTHSPSSSAARVRTLPASDPASGSVRPKAPSFAPEHRSGRSASFCSCEPKRWIGCVPSDVWAHIVMATLESTRVSSSTASAYCSVVPPAAADLLGERDAHPPELAHLGHDLVGEALLPVELLGRGRDLLHGEVADGLL